jgi:polyhydroxyalkanoate synthesis regulator phasin
LPLLTRPKRQRILQYRAAEYPPPFSFTLNQMAEKAQATAPKPGTNSGPVVVVKRGPGHRAVDARDAIAELTERAQEISLEAGSRVAIAMKDVISAAAGIAGFAVESARDLVQFMVRRGQMTPDEGDKLLREAEASHSKRPASERKKPTASEITAKERAVQRAKAAAAREHAMAQHVARTQAAHAANTKKAAPKKTASKKTKPAKRAARPKAKSAKKGSKRR